MHQSICSDAAYLCTSKHLQTISLRSLNLGAIHDEDMCETDALQPFDTQSLYCLCVQVNHVSWAQLVLSVSTCHLYNMDTACTVCVYRPLTAASP